MLHYMLAATYCVTSRWCKPKCFTAVPENDHGVHRIHRTAKRKFDSLLWFWRRWRCPYARTLFRSPVAVQPADVCLRPRVRCSVRWEVYNFRYSGSYCVSCRFRNLLVTSAQYPAAEYAVGDRQSPRKVRVDCGHRGYKIIHHNRQTSTALFAPWLSHALWLP